MDIKLKYKAWVGEKHADIAHKLMDSDIETFALEFAEHLVKNCSMPAVVGRSGQLCQCEDAPIKHFINNWCDDCQKHIV